MNETLIVTGHTEMNTHIIGPSPVPQQVGFDFMVFFRIAWYLFCIVKILSIAFFSRPKPSIRERVLRKFLISHNQLLRTFNDDDKKAMEVILDNTIKNASSRHESQGSRIRKSAKRVNFHTEKNDYYDPKQWKEEEQVFYDFHSSKEPTLGLSQNTSFEQKKHQEEFIQREDLLGLDEKTEKLAQKKEIQDQEAKPIINDLEQNILRNQAATQDEQLV